MKRNVVFTICAKNYLAQALTLRESFLEHNKCDFYIYLADICDFDVPNSVHLTSNWLEDWESMAFKYDVVEFNTALKPFAILDLFKKGYQEVIYLDPDICVYDSVDGIFELLNKKSIVLTPHICFPEENYSGFYPEEAMLRSGIFNLGFIAVKNDIHGTSMVRWWAKNLKDKCFIEMNEGLYTDQKWMDFIPSYFSEHVEISKHLGYNVAIWNIHERVVENRDGKYYVANKNKLSEVYPLVFFHFSSFYPSNKEYLSKGVNECNIHTFPELKSIIDNYALREFSNGYKEYSIMPYSFNAYDDGHVISRLNRRLYRQMLKEKEKEMTHLNLFASDGELYRYFKTNKLISREINKMGVKSISPSHFKDKVNVVLRCLRFVIRLLGVDIVRKIRGIAILLSKYESYYFLLENDNNKA